MRAGDSVSQNHCRMQEDVLLETVAIQNTKDYSSLFDTSIPMKLDQKQEIYQSGLICAKRKSGRCCGFLQPRVCRYYKNLQLFMACIFFFIFSGKLDIFMILHYGANLG